MSAQRLARMALGLWMVCTVVLRPLNCEQLAARPLNLASP